MADMNPAATANTTNQVNPQEEAKKPIFWGSQEVFDNLEKFEKISNPTDTTDWDFNFDFWGLQQETTDAPIPESTGEEKPESDAERPLDASPLTDFNFDDVVAAVGNEMQNDSEGQGENEEQGNNDQIINESNEETQPEPKNIQWENEEVKEEQAQETYDLGDIGSSLTQDEPQEEPQDDSQPDLQWEAPVETETENQSEDENQSENTTDDFVLDNVLPQEEKSEDEQSQSSTENDAIPSFDFDIELVIWKKY